MKTFKDLIFEPHLTAEGKGARMYFDNNYGISVIRFKMPSGINSDSFVCKFALAFNGHSTLSPYGSYTKNEDEWEIAVIDGNTKEVTYSTPITDNVIGYLSEKEVSKYMRKIQKLPPLEKI